LILVLAVLLAIFVLPSPWGLIAVVGAGVFEVGQTFGTLVGTRARVVERCDPVGKVAVRGEVWNARCEAGAEVGEDTVVRAVQGLTLSVERSDDTVSEPQSHQRQ